MKLHVVGLLVGTATVAVAAANVRSQDVNQVPKPLETAMRYYVEGTAAWRQENPAYDPGGEAPRFWIREYRWGPGRDVLLADAYAVFDGGRCEPLVHLVHTWDAGEKRVASQSFGLNGMHLRGSSWHESPTTLVTEVEGRLPDGSSIQFRDVADLSNPNRSVSVGHRWDGAGWVAQDTAQWERAPARVCS